MFKLETPTSTHAWAALWSSRSCFKVAEILAHDGAYAALAV